MTVVLMDLKTREDALTSPPTPIYQLKAFEKRMADLKIYNLEDFLEFLYNEECEGVYDPLTGFNVMIQEYNTTKSFPWPKMQYIGESLESDFQFRKVARKRDMIIAEKVLNFPQRFHCRVYISENKYVVISETEIDPKNIKTGVAHLLEGKGLLKNHPKPEHRIVHIQLRKKTWIQKLFTKRY